MSNQISFQTFNFNNTPIRIEIKNKEPLFCLTDVAQVLDIQNANPLRFNLKNDGIHLMYSVDSKGRKNEITFINEPNLYRVIFKSRKAEAVKFQDWIFEEVIPQIRQTGRYSIQQ
ncbi:BRO-N domain-containing protein [Volucribacter amazonae]|uniref:BRO-N domain-containing protein n=1 Tax=Volucribacter amazonae TaxID=256731 RepID=UPI0024411679|nr:BRO family protein [Volucribacter amazonae]